MTKLMELFIKDYIKYNLVNSLRHIMNICSVEHLSVELWRT